MKKSCGEVWESESNGRGVVARYWGCQLRCPLCFAQSYAYRGENTTRIPQNISLEEALNQVKKKITKRAQWCRIEGGEPFQSHEHMLMTVELSVEVLKSMERSSTAVIQTNGIWLGENKSNADKFCELIMGEMHRINEESGKRIAIEVSFKGPSSETAKVYSARSDINVHALQINAFLSLVENLEVGMWKKRRYNIAVYPVAGFGPDLTKFTFIPLDPQNASLPLFHPTTWSEDYKRNVVDVFEKIITMYPKVYGLYITKHGNKMSLYGLEPRNWQKAWTSKISKDDKIRKFALDYLRVNASQGSLNIFKGDLSMILSKITAHEELIAKASEMTEFYAWPEPARHYPYL
jgi:uncharacterized Fe-S cluster-containing radical SAM superfamily protein